MHEQNKILYLHAGGPAFSHCHYWLHLMNVIILQMNIIITLILYHMINLCNEPPPIRYCYKRHVSARLGSQGSLLIQHFLTVIKNSCFCKVP